MLPWSRTVFRLSSSRTPLKLPWICSITALRLRYNHVDIDLDLDVGAVLQIVLVYGHPRLSCGLPWSPLQRLSWSPLCGTVLKLSLRLPRSTTALTVFAHGVLRGDGEMRSGEWGSRRREAKDKVATPSLWLFHTLRHSNGQSKGRRGKKITTVDQCWSERVNKHLYSPAKTMTGGYVGGEDVRADPDPVAVADIDADADADAAALERAILGRLYSLVGCGSPRSDPGTNSAVLFGCSVVFVTFG